MKVLIVGSGGREHALAYKAAQSPLCERVLVAPGNPGTAREPKVVNVPVAADDLDGIIALAQREGVDLTIVGPEAPLVAGLCDRLGAAGIRAFGPSRAAAQLEGSKSFTKEFLRRHGIPTAAYATFTDLDQAERYIKERGAPIVVKADGLAAGKGVVVAMSVDEALAAVRGMLGGHDFGAAGAKVVIEEFMEGEEASFIVMSDSVNALPMATSQDHKRAHDHDQGPNTGGMGAYSPAPVVTPEVHARVMERIIMPTIRGMAEEGMPYHGFLYAGLMVDREGNPRVVEFNCRFGDPETQPIMMRMKSDLVDLCLRGCEPGGLSGASVDYDPRPAVGVVIAAEGYPASPRKGDPITGLGGELPPGVKIFEAGTREQGGQVVTSGGRVLCATALGEDVRDARDRAYAACGTVSFPGMFYRHDIAWRALSR